MTMKKNERTEIRLPADLKAEFAEACERADVKQSEALRHMVRAAVDYIKQQRWRWYPPRLEPDTPGNDKPAGATGARGGRIAGVVARAGRAFIAFLLLSTSDMAGVSTINGDNWCGFRQKADFQKLVRIATQGDSAAYGRMLTAGLMSGQCAMFTNGQPVYLVGPGVTLIRVRPAGHTNEYWTAIEAIGR